MNELALCAGVGGLSLGLKIAIPDHRIVCYVERESYAASTLVARMEDKTLDKAPIWDDVTTFDGQQWRGKVDIVTAGYPCQPFSTAGKKLGTKDPRHIWPDIARVIGEVKPTWVFIENVPGHLQLGFDEVRIDLRNLGFRVEPGIFSAEETGANHLRKRLFALAYAQGGRFSGRKDQQESKREIRGRSNANGKGAARREESVANASSPQRKTGGEISSIYPKRSSEGHTPDTYAGRPGWWDVEPDVGRVVNGIPRRADRLRVAGQGVVPVAAALAFVSLWEVLACNS